MLLDQPKKDLGAIGKGRSEVDDASVLPLRNDVVEERQVGGLTCASLFTTDGTVASIQLNGPDPV